MGFPHTGRPQRAQRLTVHVMRIQILCYRKNHSIGNFRNMHDPLDHICLGDGQVVLPFSASCLSGPKRNRRGGVKK